MQDDRHRFRVLLNMIALTAGQSLKLDQVLAGALEKVLDLLQVEGGTIWLVDEPAQELVTRVHLGLSDAILQAAERLKIGEGIAGRAALLGEPILLEDITGNSGPAGTIMSQEGYHFLASIPFKSKGKVVGGMDLVSRSSRQLVPEELQLLLSVGEVVAMAIDNARLLERLALSEAKYRSLFENALIGFYRSSPDGKLLLANSTFGRILGYENDKELFMACAFDFFESQADRRHWQTELERRGVFQSEIRLRRRDGAVRWASDIARVERDKEGAVLYYEGTLTDITDRKVAEEAQRRLEEQLIHSQKMQAIGTLAGGIAHDFNNILTTITGYITLLKSQISREHEFYEAFTTIEEGAGRAADLAQTLLGFARGDRYQIKAINLNQIIEKTVSLLQCSIDKRIQIDQRVEDKIWPVEADSGQMQQVLLNLCLNARDAMPAGGRLTIGSENIHPNSHASRQIQLPTPGCYVLISVSNTGIGMSSEVQKRIFEPFFTTKEKGKGTGLGLTMVRGIVENHGGCVHFTSEVGKGTTFRVYLPASPGTAVEGPPASEVEASHGTELILVADDDPGIRVMVRNILQGNGYRVVVAENGEAALETYRRRRHEISLAIIDNIMPGMGGSETFLKLKAINPEVKVILSSGHGGEKDMQNIIIQGVRAFVQKPYAALELASLVRKVLDTGS